MLTKHNLEDLNCHALCDREKKAKICLQVEKYRTQTGPEADYFFLKILPFYLWSLPEGKFLNENCIQQTK